LTDDYYKQWFTIKSEAIKNGLYLRTLSNREFLAQLIGMNAADWGRKSNERGLTVTDRMRYIWKSLQYLHIAEKLDPTNEQTLQDLAGGYEFMHYLETKDSMPGIEGLNPAGSRSIAAVQSFDRYQQLSWAKDLATAQAYYRKALALGLDPYYYSPKYKRDYLADIPRLKKNHEIFQKKLAEDEERLQEFVRKIVSDRRSL
jgi:hypothetical protein